MKEIKKNLKSPLFFISMATAAKFVQPIPIFWAYLIPLDVDVVPIKFHQFLFGEYHFCVFQFFSISGVSMATTAILKKINPSQHNITWHMIFLQGFIKFDYGISKKSSGQKCVEE